MTATPVSAGPALFVTPRRVLTGVGTFAQLGSEVARLGCQVLIVCGRSALRRSGNLDKALGSAKSAGAEAHVFDRVEPEPSLATVDAGRQACRAAKCEVVVGIGGGSVLDVAKAIAGLSNSPLPIQQHFEGAPAPETGLPLVAVPTTAGTGSEATMNSVLSAPDTDTKKSIRGDALLPTTAIVDPELLLSLPPDLTAHAGLDALTQAIESFTSRHATPITDALAFEAFRLLADGLPRVMADGNDIAARSLTSLGSLMAGMALANARLGIVHGLAHPLGIAYHIPHGLVCGALLPFAIRFNRAAAEEKYDRLSASLGRPLLEFVEDMLERAGLTGALKRFAVKPEDVPVLAERSLPSGSLKANPRPVSKEDLVDLLRQATS